jgi:hypothetical protein
MEVNNVFTIKDFYKMSCGLIRYTFKQVFKGRNLIELDDFGINDGKLDKLN